MPNIDEIRAKMPCPLHTMFCIINQIQTDCVEPWYGQIKQLADGADKWNSGMHKAVIFGMYPELEKASKEWFSKYKDIYNEFEENPNKDKGVLSNSLKKLSLQIGEQYGLNENRYLFNKMTEEQAKRVQERKEIEIKKMCKERAEEMIDPLHIVMQGLCEKVTPKDCKKLMSDFGIAEVAFKYANDHERMELCKKKFPDAYSIYEQVKKSLEVANIKDCYQMIDHKNYKQFAQTLGNFKYKGKEYNLLDAVRPITHKRDAFGGITEVRVPLQPNKRVLGG